MPTSALAAAYIVASRSRALACSGTLEIDGETRRQRSPWTNARPTLGG